MSLLKMPIFSKWSLTLSFFYSHTLMHKCYVMCALVMYGNRTSHMYSLFLSIRSSLMWWQTTNWASVNVCVIVFCHVVIWESVLPLVRCRYYAMYTQVMCLVGFHLCTIFLFIRLYFHWWYLKTNFKGNTYKCVYTSVLSCGNLGEHSVSTVYPVYGCICDILYARLKERCVTTLRLVSQCHVYCLIPKP